MRFLVLLLTAVSGAILLVVTLWEGAYFIFYSFGCVGQLSPLRMFLVLVELLFVPAFIALSMVQLHWGKKGRWALGTLLAVAVFLGVTRFVLPPLGFMSMYGTKDSVLSVASLDDLRQLALAVDKYKIQTQGSKSELAPDQAVAFRQLREKYPFLKWQVGSRDVLISERGNVVTFEWVGSRAGNWGFKVGLGPVNTIDLLRLN
jgi:hypothetical protein